MARRARSRAALALALCASALTAEPYRLGPGDRVQLGFAGQGTAEEMTVDADGQIRLAQVGGIALSGLTLDEAETAVEQAVAGAGLYVDPRATLVVTGYAPVIVAGDVAAPGAYGYQPGLSVAAALALAGGMGAQGLGPFDRARALAEAETTMQSLNLEIAGAALTVARLEAALAGGAMALTPVQRAAVPDPLSAGLAARGETERAILEAGRSRTRDLVAQWDSEIDALVVQQGILARRLELQRAIADSAAADLATATKLQERGLQTASRQTDMVRRDGDARAGLLELESARIAAARALADARRQKAQYLAGQRFETLSALQAARLALETATLRHERARRMAALLAGGAPGPGARLVRISPRPGRAGPVAADATLWPGETLVVTAGGPGDG